LLALTDSAVQAVRQIVSSEEVSETGGLRVVAERAGMQTNFQLSVVPLPAEDDEVIEGGGSRRVPRAGGSLTPRRQGPRRQSRAGPGRVHDRRPDLGGAGEFQLARRGRRHEPDRSLRVCLRGQPLGHGEAAPELGLPPGLSLQNLASELDAPRVKSPLRAPWLGRPVGLGPAVPQFVGT
jgi:hypothetical protein